MTLDALIPVPGGWIGAVFLVVCGLVVCGHGSGLVRLALGLSGFVLAGTVGAGVTALFTPSPLWSGVAFVLAGLLGAALAGMLLPVGTFVLGGVLGYALCSLFVPSAVVSWIAALVWAVIFLVLQKRVLALGTAALGSLMVLEGVLMLLLVFDPVREAISPYLEGLIGSVVFLVSFLLLALAGYRRQVGRKKKERDDDD